MNNDNLSHEQYLWDNDLTKNEAQGLSPKDRALRNRTSFARKVAIFEARLDAGTIDLDFRKKAGDPSKLRRWHDAALGLWRWSTKSVDSARGNNADLRQRYDAALEALDARTRSNSRINPMVPTALSHNLTSKRLEVTLQTRIAALERQNIDLISQLAALQSRKR